MPSRNSLENTKQTKLETKRISDLTNVMWRNLFEAPETHNKFGSTNGERNGYLFRDFPLSPNNQKQDNLEGSSGGEHRGKDGTVHREISEFNLSEPLNSDINKKRESFASDISKFNLSEPLNSGINKKRESFATEISEFNLSESWPTSPKRMHPKVRENSTIRTLSEIQQEVAEGELDVRKYITDIKANEATFIEKNQAIDKLVNWGIEEDLKVEGMNTSAKSNLEDYMGKLQEARNSISAEINKLINCGDTIYKYYSELQSEIDQLKNEYLKNHFTEKITSQESTLLGHNEKLLKHLGSRLGEIDAAIEMILPYSGDGYIGESNVTQEIQLKKLFADQYSWSEGSDEMVPKAREGFARRSLPELQREIMKGKEVLGEYLKTLSTTASDRTSAIDQLVGKHLEVVGTNANDKLRLEGYMKELQEASKPIRDEIEKARNAGYIRAEHYRILEAEIDELVDNTVELMMTFLLNDIREQSNSFQEYNKVQLKDLESQLRKTNAAMKMTQSVLDNKQYSWPESSDGMLPEARAFSIRSNLELQQEVEIGQKTLQKYLNNLGATLSKRDVIVYEIVNKTLETNVSTKSYLEEHMGNLQEVKNSIVSELDKLRANTPIIAEHHDILRSEIILSSNNDRKEEFLQKIDGQDSHRQQLDENLTVRLEAQLGEIEEAIDDTQSTLEDLLSQE